MALHCGTTCSQILRCPDLVTCIWISYTQPLWLAMIAAMPSLLQGNGQMQTVASLSPNLVIRNHFAVRVGHLAAAAHPPFNSNLAKAKTLTLNMKKQKELTRVIKPTATWILTKMQFKWNLICCSKDRTLYRFRVQHLSASTMAGLISLFRFPLRMSQTQWHETKKMKKATTT